MMKSVRFLGFFAVFAVVCAGICCGNAWASPADTYTYDSLNRLVKVRYGNGNSISYTYDNAGNRIVLKETFGPPYTPSSPVPASGATGVSISGVTLSWSGGDPNGKSVSYDVYFGTTDPPTDVASSGQAGTSFDPGTLFRGTTYYWQVVATDVDGQSSGPVWSFTTLGLRDDLNGDGQVDINDIRFLQGYLNQPASACPACDIDGDGKITVLDARKLALTCTYAYCATGP